MQMRNCWAMNGVAPEIAEKKMTKITLTEAAGIICIIASGTLGTYIAGAKGLAVALLGVVGVAILVLGVLQEW